MSGRKKTYTSKKKRTSRRMGYAKPKASRGISWTALSTRSNMGKTGVPPSMAVQLRTFDNKAIAPGAQAVAYYFQLNSTFAPLSGAGGVPAFSAVQPIGRDQLATLYGSYMVNSGSIKFGFINTGAAPVMIACYTSPAAVVAADINNYSGQPGSKHGICSPAASGDTQCILARSFSCSQIVGPLDRSSHGAAVGASPTGIAYCYLYIYATTGNVTGHLSVELTQNTIFFDKTAVVHA